MQSLSKDKVRMLEAVARRVAPGISDLDAAGLSRFFELVDGALLERPAGMRRRLAVFLGILRWSPVFLYGRTFERLEPQRQDAVLRRFEDSPISLFRQGLWGLKALVYLGYYGQPEVCSAIGYAPVRDGNAKLHA